MNVQAATVDPFAAVTPDWVMPFGKYRGATLKEIKQKEASYLKWVASDKCTYATEELKAACRDLLDGIQDIPTFPGFAPPADMVSIARVDLNELHRQAVADTNEIARLRAEVSSLKRQMKSRDEAIPGADGVRLLIRRWFGSMSRRFHPDAGGTAEQQSVVNICYRELTTMLEER